MKTNYQLSKNAFGVITFLLTAVSLFNETLVLGLLLLLGYALVLEKDKWMAKQTLQGLFLSIFATLSLEIISLFSFNITFGYEELNLVLLLSFAIEVMVIVFIIIGVLRNAKGLDADLPVFTVFANKALGIIIEKKEEPKETPLSEEINIKTDWLCSCGRINQGSFCSICGKEKE